MRKRANEFRNEIINEKNKISNISNKSLREQAQKLAIQGFRGILDSMRAIGLVTIKEYEILLTEISELNKLP